MNTDTPTTKSFRVVSVSTRANSFGLHGHILVARDGAAFWCARSIGAWNTPWPKGSDVTLPLNFAGQPDWPAVSVEIPRALPAAPAALLRDIFRD